MILDVFNKPYEIKVNEKTYKLEYDNAAYIELEHKTGKGTFELCGKVIDAIFGLEECLQIALCGLSKYHQKDEINEIKEIFIKTPYILVSKTPTIIQAFLTPLMPPRVMEKLNNKEANTPAKKLVNPV